MVAKKFHMHYTKFIIEKSSHARQILSHALQRFHVHVNI